jgi:hypothetical protein
MAGTKGAINTRVADLRPSLKIELKGKDHPMTSSLTFKFVALKTLETSADDIGSVNIP